MTGPEARRRDTVEWKGLPPVFPSKFLKNSGVRRIYHLLYAISRVFMILYAGTVRARTIPTSFPCPAVVYTFNAIGVILDEDNP